MTAGPRRLLLSFVTLFTVVALPFVQRHELGADSCSPEAPPGNYGTDLDGQGSRIDLGAPPALAGTVFTLEAWVRRQGPGLATSTGEVQAIPILTRGRDEAGSEGNNLDLNWFLGLRASDGVLVADFEDDAIGANHPAAGTTAIPLHVWTHVAATYDGGTWRLYVNGALETTLAVGATPRADALAHAAIGTAFDSAGAADGWFDGVVDEARVWSVARGDGDILAGMAAAIASAAGLAGRWGLDEGIGTVALDSSGGLNHGTLSAGVSVRGTPFASQPEALVDHALEFDGAAAHVSFGTAGPLGLATFTIEAWFNRRGTGIATSTGVDGVVAIPLAAKGRDEGEGDATDLNWFLGLRAADGVLVADFEDAATGANHPVAGTTTVLSGRWNHAAAVFDGATWRLYLNGILEAEAAAAFTPRSDSLAHAALGSALDSAGTAAGFFDGSLDEVRVWSVARSGAEIQDGLKREITTGTGLVARYGLSEGTGASIADPDHPAAPVGTVVSGTWVDGYPFADRLVVADDTCDGIDQDCDGTPDDGYVPVMCGTTDVGACALGTSVCTNGTIGCSGNIEPTTEVCDGADNDCDGATDEALGTLTCGAGVCAASMPACAGGVPQTCIPGPPQTGTSLSFDGVDDSVDFGNHASINTHGTQSFTVEEWFKATSFGPNAGIFRAGRQGSWSQVVIQTPASAPFNRLTVSVESNSQEQIDTAPVEINPNQWYHVAAVIDRGAGEVRVYLDGNLVATSDSSLWGSATIGDTFYSTVIGAARRSDETLGNFFSGAIDELRIWNQARTAQQIQAHRFQAITTAPGLLARWGFDAGAGTQAVDSVSGGALNNGSLTNGTAWLNESGMGVESACDGLDNDCDGLVDEDDQSVPTICGSGVCVSTGVTSCVNGVVQDSCIPLPGAPNDASCNNVDDDCDGLVDEDFVGQPITCGEGVCGATGTTTCAYGQPGVSCQPNRPAANYGLDLDGAGSYVTMGHVPALGLQTYTVEVWFKRHGTGVGCDTGQQGLSEAVPLVSRGRGEADGGTMDMNWFLGVGQTNGRLEADFEEYGTGLNHPVVGATPTAPDVWYHGAVTYDGSHMRLYLNGVLEAEHFEQNAVPRYDSAQHVAIGSALNTLGQPSGWFDGVIDEARVWNYARSAAEIQADLGHPVLSSPGLVARWALDDTAGSAVHDSAGTANGTLTSGSFVTGTPFAIGPSPNPDHAVALDGRVSRIVIPPTPALGLQTFTIETWFNRKWLGDYTDTGSGGLEAVPLIAKGRGEAEGDNRDINYFLGLRYSDSRLMADFEDMGGGNHPLQGTAAIPDGTWNHVAAVYDGASWRLYLNGRLEAIQQGVTATPRFDSIQPIGFGSAFTSEGSPGGFFAGEMNEVRIWSVARTQTQIQDGMFEQIASAPGLVGRWALTENTGTLVADTAGLPAHDGTLESGAWADGYPFNNKP
ncbi:MAG TPA: LamG domain-containing protein, partial [Candidatus Polarisedimenticolia bacterium]|nr:LamG domain-containing protein [Candidatus Polarisedimenticolia bacterium]